MGLDMKLESIFQYLNGLLLVEGYPDYPLYHLWATLNQSNWALEYQLQFARERRARHTPLFRTVLQSPALKLSP